MGYMINLGSAGIFSQIIDILANAALKSLNRCAFRQAINPKILLAVLLSKAMRNNNMTD
ncbi:hypothetical protein FACS189445_3650 [Spirochaetia bacterium]|nr:hypothetical protein FACS189445_3650 [Spirochaetia bacterium]